MPRSREDYLDRLADLLPARDVARVREDVEAMILERVDDLRMDDPALDAAAAETRALAALGPPEHLADEIVSDPVKISLATRRTFVRVLAVVFAGHLLLSIVLTVAGSEAAAIYGLLGPLPRASAPDVALAVVVLFLLDAGLVLVLFIAIGQGRPERALPGLQLRARWTRKGAIEGLVLVILLAVIANWFVDSIFSVKQGGSLRGFLAADVKAILPYVNVVLGLFALRHVLTLVGQNEAPAIAADCLACLAGVAVLIWAATVGDAVQMPSETLGHEAADVLDDLIERVFLVVFVGGALLLTVRFVRHGMHLWRTVRAG